jgi:hypothetical protein
VSTEISPDELRRMALAIDAGLEPRVHLDAELSAEGAQRLHDVVTAVKADLSQHAGIETTWPLECLLAALEGASA